MLRLAHIVLGSNNHLVSCALEVKFVKAATKEAGHTWVFFVSAVFTNHSLSLHDMATTGGYTTRDALPTRCPPHCACGAEGSEGWECGEDQEVVGG